MRALTTCDGAFFHRKRKYQEAFTIRGETGRIRRHFLIGKVEQSKERILPSRTYSLTHCRNFDMRSTIVHRAAHAVVIHVSVSYSHHNSCMLIYIGIGIGIDKSCVPTHVQYNLKSYVCLRHPQKKNGGSPVFHLMCAALRHLPTFILNLV